MNSITSSMVAMPPMPTMGILTARATCQTQRRANGLMAGPDRPPMPLPRIGFLRRQSMAIPRKVLTKLTASQPPSAAPWAISTMLVTLGVSLASRGKSGQASRADATTARQRSGFVAKSIPPATLGQERLSSNAAIPGRPFTRAAMRGNSSADFAAMLSTIGQATSVEASHGR